MTSASYNVTDVPPCQVLLATGTLERTLDNLSAQPEKRALVVCDATRSDLLLGLSAVHSTEKGPHLAAILLTGAAQLDPRLAQILQVSHLGFQDLGMGSGAGSSCLLQPFTASRRGRTLQSFCSLRPRAARIRVSRKILQASQIRVLGFRFQQPACSCSQQREGAALCAIMLTGAAQLGLNSAGETVGKGSQY